MWGKESSRGRQPFKAGCEPPANKFLFDAVKTPDHVSLQDGENPEKNTGEEGGSCPGSPQGSGPERLGWVAAVQPLQELPVPGPPHCFLEAEISPALERKVSPSREHPASLHFLLVRVPRSSSALPSRVPGVSSLTMSRAAPAPPLWTGLQVRLEILPAHPSLRRNLSFQGGRAACGKARAPWNVNYPGRDECVIARTWQLLIER